jgi:DNA-binding beta-propeller fold protein YncE
VIVGNVPATYDSQGNLVSVGQGSLRILDSKGNVVTNLSDSLFLDGPWDLTVNDQGSTAQVFVSNVLNGVVTRIDLSIPKGGNPIVESLTRIASGYITRTDPAALVVGPTGLAYNPTSGVLYVPSTGDNEIFAVPSAASRTSDGATGSVI